MAWPLKNYGIGFLDMAAFEKPLYYQRKSWWTNEPMVYLAVPALVRENRKPVIRHFSHWNWKAGSKLNVLCYTNCDQAELFLNNVSQGIRYMEDSTNGMLSWDVEYEEGELKVIADGCGHLLKTAKSPARIQVESDVSALRADGEDVCHIEMKLYDKNGAHVPNGDNEITVTVSDGAELLGLENGDGTDLRPYCESTKNAYQGRLLAYIRAGLDKKTVTVTAEAEELPRSSVEIQII